MFSNRDLKKLLIPLIIDQLMLSLMGIADTMMVSNVNQAAISGVSLVDSINTLILYLFSALATGSAIVCAQYLGRRDEKNANVAARQALLSSLALALVIMIPCIFLRQPLLRLIFGSVEADVMQYAQTYFWVTALSYPFIALFNTSSALYRSVGNSRLPMLVSGSTNLMNIAGNALFIFAFQWNVFGAALSTLLSRVVAAGVMLYLQHKPAQVLSIQHMATIRPRWSVIALVLSVGIPAGVENGMFQFGKLMVQSTVSTLGTDAMAAQAIVAMLENITSMPSIAIGLGLMTVVGQCMGANRPDEARRYIIKLTIWSEGILVAVSLLVYALTGTVTHLASMSAAGAALTCDLMLWITVAKPLIWVPAFIPAYGLRAAGDVKFAMILSTCSMWIFRVVLSYYLCRYTEIGLLGVWLGMFTDWMLRAVAFSIRFLRGRWMTKTVLRPQEELAK